MVDDVVQDIETNDAEEIPASLCTDCARHPSVKRMVAADCTKGLCALCARDDADVRNPGNLEPLVMLIRALIRFHYDEHEYNPHWGGDSVMSLFYSPDNPILEPPKSDLYIDDFDQWLNWPPYPEWNEGISVFAGFNDGDRMMNFAISRTKPNAFVELQRRLLTENFHQVEPGLDELIAPFLQDIEMSIPAGDVWYRARLGEAATYRSMKLDGWKQRIIRIPWQNAEIGAPPPPKAGFGRLNRAGVSVMYLGSEPDTAVAEIRPHPGHHVSVGGFRSIQAIRLADFDPDISIFSTSDVRLTLYETVQAFDRLMSLPVTPDERTPYLLTQLLAEVLLRRGFDGVRYRSSVSTGSNICIFYPEKFEFIPQHSEVRRITSLRYGTVHVPSQLAPDRHDQPYHQRG